jgi:RDD family
MAARFEAMGLSFVLFVVTLGIGWLIWNVVEWRNGRTASFRLRGLRVVRQSDGKPIGLCRSTVRNAVCCTLLVVPTIVVCVLIGLAFLMGASAPDGLMKQPRRAPWDVLTGTKVLDQRARLASRKRLRLDSWPEDVSVSLN